MAGPTNADLDNRIHEMAKQLAALQANHETSTRLAAEERLSVRAKIERVDQKVEAVEGKIDKVASTIQGFIDRTEGGRAVVRFGWKVGAGLLAVIGGIAAFVGEWVPKFLALIAR